MGEDCADRIKPDVPDPTIILNYLYVIFRVTVMGNEMIFVTDHDFFREINYTVSNIISILFQYYSHPT